MYSTLRSANVARNILWAKGTTPPRAFRSLELGGEAGEACNVIKKLERERFGWAGSRDTVAHLGEELADVVICADLIGMDLDVPFDPFWTVNDAYLGKPATVLGSELMAEVGRACGYLNSGYSTGDICGALMGVTEKVGEIALKYEIDLKAAVAAKFNATSEKVGLPTRMAA